MCSATLLLNGSVVQLLCFLIVLALLLCFSVAVPHHLAQGVKPRLGTIYLSPSLLIYSAPGPRREASAGRYLHFILVYYLG